MLKAIPAHLYFSVYAVLFFVMVPVTVLVINAIVVREVRRASDNAAVNLGLQQHQQSTSSNSAVPTAMLVITSLVYVLLNAGSSVIPVLQWWMPRAAFSETTWVALDKISMVAFAAHTCIYAYNFYVYLVTGKQFRCELHKLICRCRSAAADAARVPTRRTDLADTAV